MTSYAIRLKDPRTCRIFFSSPFNGMEEEREELTRKYFPQIHHLCNAHGIQFVAVDMRWGITKESAESAQVINICLGELDRSDIFIGFFGQRYGWHGADDGLLQRNFDNSVGQYPWLDSVREKSVTELEYLHGHLNNPGALPTCILFRNKAYDDRMREEGERTGNKKMVYKYSPESPHAIDLIKDLKRRVQATEDKTLGVHMDYKHPHDAAKLMFEAIMNHLTEVLLVSAMAENLSPRETALADHDAFVASRVMVYVGGNDYFTTLDGVLDAHDGKCVVVTGPAGCGKSALLCKWLMQVKETRNPPVLVYHFIGCAMDSDKPENILRRLTTEVDYALQNFEEKCPEKESLLDTTEWDRSITSVMDNFRTSLNKASQQDKKVTIIIDGLDKIESSGKVVKPLCWLHGTFPSGVSVIMATVDTDKTSLKELIGTRGFEELNIQPLDRDAKSQMAIKTLQEVGKEFSKHQLDKVVNEEQTSNPLFLKIVMSELAVFGYFSLLDKKIDSLIAADGVGELFQKFLERLEQDYNVSQYPGNLVQKVFSALFVAHEGLSETEIMEIFKIPSHVWAPLNFAMEKFIINHSGLLGFAFTELKQAVRDKYLKEDKDRIEITKDLIEYFDNKRKKFKIWMQLTDPSVRRTAFELPWLQKDINDIDGLITSLTDMFIFGRLDRDAQYELLELWRFTGLSFTDIADLYMKSFDETLSDMYSDQQENLVVPGSKSPGYLLQQYLSDLRLFMELAECSSGVQKIILRLMSLMENCQRDYDTVTLEREKQILQYTLACNYVDTGRFHEAESLHYAVKDCLEKSLENEPSEDIEISLAKSYNGIGLLYMLQFQYEKALPWLEKSLKVHRKFSNQRNKAESIQTCGMCYLELGDIEKALQYTEEAYKIFEELYFGLLPHQIGYVLMNLGVCYRRLGRFDEAEKAYKKSLDVKVAAVGWDHPSIGVALMNLGTLENIRGHYDKAEDYSRRGCDVYQKNGFPEDYVTYRQLLENLVNTMIYANKYEEAVPLFWKVFNLMTRLDLMDQCMPDVYDRMAGYFNNTKQYDDSERVILTLMNSKKKTAVTYIILDLLDANKPKEERTKRPYEMTLDYALSQMPGDGTLVTRKACAHLIPHDDTEGLIQLLRTMDLNSEYHSEMYGAGAEWCEKDNKLEMAVSVLKFGIDKYPQDISLKTKLLEVLRTQAKYPEILSLIKELSVLMPHNTALFLIGADAATRCSELVLARQWCVRVIESDNEDFAEKAKHLLSLVESVLAEKEEENCKNKSSGEN